MGMRILVVGANGRTGRHIVRQALGHGHDVTALVRDPARFDVRGEGLRVLAGDPLDPATLGPAIDGQAAVISVLGGPLGADAHVRADGTANLIRSMTARHVDRLVVVSTDWMSASGAELPLMRRMQRVVPGFMERLTDFERMEGDVQLSSLAWTIVRAAPLTDGPQTGHYRIGETGIVPKGKRISRADLAATVLKITENGWYPGRAVAVAY